MNNDQLTRDEHDRLLIRRRLAMDPSQRVRENASMCHIWHQGQLNKAAAIAARRKAAEHGDQ